MLTGVLVILIVWCLLIARAAQSSGGTANREHLSSAKAAGRSVPGSHDGNGPSPAVDRALRHASQTYGVPYWQMRNVAWCESRWNPNAVGNGSHGLFQFLRGTWARTPFGRYYIYSPWWNAHAAAWLVRHDGYSWREWSCRP